MLGGFTCFEIVVVGNDRGPRGAMQTWGAKPDPVPPVPAPDLDDAQGARVDEIGVAVAADAIFAARIGLPAREVAQSDAREERVPRRRGAEEFASLLEIPAMVELELIAGAQKSARRREPRFRRQALLPAVEILEAVAAGDVPELIAPAQLAAGIQAQARLRIERRALLEAVAADVRRV